MKILYSAPRGTKDILPDETKIWRKIKKKAIEVSERFGFSEMIFPTFEEEKLFIRSVGEETDVVQKEMFTFLDSAGRRLALRPEGTASLARAVIENGLLNEALPLKLFYIINCFRNERPQKGRYKEFYQLGVELFGSSLPTSELEVISLAKMFFEELNIKNLTLNINSIGCSNCRKDFVLKLIDYFKEHENKLCKTCKERLNKNPLRILDCKEEECEALKENAPKILDNVCSSCKEHFKTVEKLLKNNNIDYVVNHKIVRGLDYYTRTVFEFKTNELGSQDTICGGGRYDGLFEELGAKKTPALGFGVGLNRLFLLLKDKEKIENYCDLYIGHISENAMLKATKIAQNLREKNIKVQTNLLERSVKAQMKYANKINAKYSIIIGDNELNSNEVELKNMDEEQTKIINLNNFESEFLKFINSN